MSCDVWWAWIGDLRERHVELLDAPERTRLASLRKEADRQRYVVGVAVTRLVLGERLGRPPEQVAIDRTCGDCGAPHARPRVAEPARVRLSVAHAGELVGVAVASGGAHVGLDVEQVDGSLGVVELAGEPVLSPAEVARLRALPHEQRAGGLLRYWTRKEAVLKATGDGLKVDPSAVAVSAPDDDAVLLGFAGRPGLEQRARLADLFPAPGYAGALCLLGTGASGPRPQISEHDAGALLRG